MDFKGHKLIQLNSSMELKYYRCEMCGIIFYQRAEDIDTFSFSIKNFTRNKLAKSETLVGLSCKEIIIKELIE